MRISTLYKKDSKGKLRVWEIWTDGDILSERAGLINGGLVQHNKQIAGKNVGRANETTPAAQAAKEAEAKYKKKLDEGYFLTEEEAMNTVVILPMLATAFEKVRKKIDWTTAVLQPKLDGMRCLSIIDEHNNVQMISRKGKPITTLSHLVSSIQALNIAVPPGETVIIDGEVYAHGLSFQENMKLIKKYRPGQTESVKYHVYDIVDEEGYANRYIKLLRYIPEDQTKAVHLVPTTSNLVDGLDAFHATALVEGYEGTMIRWGSAPYELDKRSKNLVKYKDFKDLACPITDIIPMDAYPNQGLVVCSLDGKTFKATPKMSHAEREELLNTREEHIGRTAEIRFFEYTDDMLPRFPVFLGVREDK